MSKRETGFSLNTQFSILVLLMMVPSLILLVFSLWILSGERRDIQIARQGLATIETFERLLQPDLDDPQADHAVFAATLDRVVAGWSDDQQDEFASRIEARGAVPSLLLTVELVQ